MVFYWKFSGILTFQIKYAYFEANLIVTPQRDGDRGKYLHITKVDLNTSSLQHSITLGPFEVQKILAWDEKQKQM